jgi:hypothetical protein
VVLQRQEQLDAVVSLQLKSERELIAALTTGSDATFAAEARPNGITVLQRKGTPSELSLAAYRGRLVVGKDPGLLLESAPYLAADAGKVTNAGAPFELWIAHAVLAEKLGPYLRSAWSRYSSELIDAEQAQISQHGRAADLADPKAVIVGLSSLVESVVAFFESAEALRFSAIPEAERLTISVEVEPGKGGAAREFLGSLASGGLREMASLPGQTKVVLASYDADQAADRFAARAAAGFTTLFGQRLRKQDHDQISSAFADLAKGFAAPTLYGSLESGDASAFFIKSRLEDREAFQRGLTRFAALSQLPALTNLFDNTIGGVKPLPKKWDAAVLGGPGGGVTFRIGGTKGVPKEESSLVWFEHGGFGYVVFGENPQPFLAELREPKQGLGSVPEASKLLDFETERASFAALMRADADTSSLSGSSLAFGWDGSRGRLRLRASRAPVRELVALLQKLGASDEGP